MKTREFYRDGLTEEISGPIRVLKTSDGHIVERYTLTNGKKRYFATLAGSHWTAHGDSIAAAGIGIALLLLEAGIIFYRLWRKR